MTREYKDYNCECRVQLIGDSQVGKSCLIIRAAENTYSPHYISSIGVEYKKRLTEAGNYSVIFKLYDSRAGIWDKSLTIDEIETTMKNLGAIGTRSVYMLVFDLTDEISFQNLESYANAIRRHSNALLFVIGTKSDLKSERKVTSEEGQEFAQTLKCPYFEVSAKDGSNVEEAFTALAKDYCEKRFEKTYISTAKTATERRKESEALEKTQANAFYVELLKVVLPTFGKKVKSNQYAHVRRGLLAMKRELESQLGRMDAVSRAMSTFDEEYPEAMTMRELKKLRKLANPSLNEIHTNQNFNYQIKIVGLSAAILIGTVLLISGIIALTLHVGLIVLIAGLIAATALVVNAIAGSSIALGAGLLVAGVFGAGLMVASKMFFCEKDTTSSVKAEPSDAGDLRLD